MPKPAFAQVELYSRTSSACEFFEHPDTWGTEPGGQRQDDKHLGVHPSQASLTLRPTGHAQHYAQMR